MVFSADGEMLYAGSEVGEVLVISLRSKAILYGQQVYVLFDVVCIVLWKITKSAE